MTSAAARPPDHTIAVVGMGLVVPGASSPDQLWRLLSEPADVFSEPGERFDLDAFWSAERDEEDRTYQRTAGYVHDLPAETEVQPETALLRACLTQALATTSTADHDRVECIVGTWPGGNSTLLRSALVDELTSRTSASGEGVQAVIRKTLGAGSPFVRDQATDARAALKTAADGILPAGTQFLILDSACSTALYAIDVGARELLSGCCDIAFCGGFSLLEPTMSVLFSKISGLSADGRLRALETAADGTVFSDAAALVALKRLDRARADGDTVLGVLAGFGAAADGRGRSIAAPNPRGQRLALERALAVNDLSPASVDWIIAHATGTRAGDASELDVLAQLAPPNGWWLSANKAVVGHAGWAAGAVSVIHALLALRHGEIPAHPRPATAVPAEGRLRVPQRPSPWPHRSGRPRTAGVSAFGFGGTNGHLLIQDVPEDVSPPASRRAATTDPLVLVGWSASLPGAADSTTAGDILVGRAQPAAEQRTPPGFDVTGLPSTVVAAIDHRQVMALEVAHRFATETGELWATLRERTGVIAAQTGLPETLLWYAIRAHATESAHAFPDGSPQRAAVEASLDRVRRLVPPAGPDAMPGVLPNVVPSRVCARYDLQGLSLSVDTGTSSTAAAIAVAADYLTTGDLDLALVIALDSESAFLLALSRESLAEERQWQVVARLEPGHDNRAADSDDAGFQAAEGAAAIIRGVLRGSPGQRLTYARDGRSVTLAIPGECPRQTRRFVPVMRAVPHQPPNNPRHVPRGAVALTDSAMIAAQLTELAESGAVVVCTQDGELPPGVSDGNAPNPLHLLVVADHSDSAWPAVQSGQSRRLHEILLLLLQRTTASRHPGSLGIVVIEPSGAPGGHPHSALFEGLIPSLILDHPQLPVRVVATDEQDVEKALEQLAGEWTAPTGQQPVRFRQGTRHVQRLAAKPITPVDVFPVRDGDVLVAAGGSGGMMTSLLTVIARQARPVVWLLGSTSPDEIPPDIFAADDTALRGLRAELIADLLRQQPGGSVRSAAAHVDRLISGRNRLRNVAQLRRLLGPSHVHYVTCDVTDPAAAAAAAAEIGAHHDRIDLFLNAVTRSRTASLAAKTLNDFRLVRDSKVLGQHHLRTAFAPLGPRLWCDLASAASVVPLAGEVDYGPANAFLLSAAAWASDEIAIGLPLLRDSGFVAERPELLAELLRHNRLTPVDDHEATTIVLAEIAAAKHRTRADVASVYLGDRELRAMAAERPGYVESTVPRPAPGLLHSARWTGQGWAFTLDDTHHTYLRHHLVQAKPALPGTFLLELAVDTAMSLAPDLVPIAILNAAFDAFARPASAGRTREFVLTVQPSQNHDRDDGTVLSVRLDSTTTVGAFTSPPMLHFSADVVLAAPRHRAPPTPVRFPDGDPAPPDPYYYSSSPVWLSGPFVNTRRWRTAQDGNTALWRSNPDTLRAHPVLSRMVLPALLICATLRARTLSPDDGGRRAVVVPRRLARMDIHLPGNDIELATSHPDGILTVYRHTDDTYAAATTDGTPILTLAGFEGVALDHELLHG